jgi:dipeptide transport system substrate-binding protein
MRTRVLFKVAALAGMLALTGCASKLAQPNQYSGFLKDYSNLKEATTASGKSELRWIDPNYNPANYDNVVYHPVTYYPVPKPTTQVGEKALQDILNYTNKQLKQAISERKPLATTAGKRSLIFRGAITGVDSSKEGLQFYEVVPVAMIVAGTRRHRPSYDGHRPLF